MKSVTCNAKCRDSSVEFHSYQKLTARSKSGKYYRVINPVIHVRKVVLDYINIDSIRARLTQKIEGQNLQTRSSKDSLRLANLLSTMSLFSSCSFVMDRGQVAMMYGSNYSIGHQNAFLNRRCRLSPNNNDNDRYHRSKVFFDGLGVSLIILLHLPTWGSCVVSPVITTNQGSISTYLHFVWPIRL